ncbi:hypothetical protein FH972_024572 [Carpinus fangiana]|uniref:Uncharacterized protein n=1 Tax=Carpinus fangiana TaxID=176857 RepID=A0A5N6KYD7_9ROSI|nr:hypothetical protein FH972_024572 [Carpinus fangiana]
MQGRSRFASDSSGQQVCGGRGCRRWSWKMTTTAAVSGRMQRRRAEWSGARRETEGKTTARRVWRREGRYGEGCDERRGSGAGCRKSGCAWVPSTRR